MTSPSKILLIIWLMVALALKHWHFLLILTVDSMIVNFILIWSDYSSELKASFKDSLACNNVQTPYHSIEVPLLPP